MKWAITGGGGQLARSLTDLLDKQGFTYRSWGKQELDITNPDSTESIVDFAPNVLVNCAAWTNVDGAETHFEEALSVNRDGARNMALAARKLEIPLIHISTDYVFSGSSEKPWTVNDITNPSSKYGESKLQGEMAIQEACPDKSLILRTAWLYGPYGKNFAKTIIKKALLSQDEIKVVNDQIGQPTTTTDLASKILETVNLRIVSGIYHGTNSGEATWWEFARELFYLSGESVERVTAVSSDQFPSHVKRPAYSVLDHSTWDKIGLSPMRDWRDALREIYPVIRVEVEKELRND
jgi:dTDP-4-dehydrorhamnose reductase